MLGEYMKGNVKKGLVKLNDIWLGIEILTKNTVPVQTWFCMVNFCSE